MRGVERTPANFADALPPVFMAAAPVALLSIVFAVRTPARELRHRMGASAEEPPVLAEPYV